MKKLALTFVLLSVFCGLCRAQFTDCSSGLLQMPSAEMMPDGGFIITNNWLNSHSLPTSIWGYDTFQYGFAVSLWGRFEIGYICTILDGRKTSLKDEYWRIMFNQDRHFSGRVMLLRENEFGLEWMPALVAGISDPITGYAGDYMQGMVRAQGNGYFNRAFVVLSKHFQTPWGKVGAHAGYQYSLRRDYPINAPCAGITWNPVWLQNDWFSPKFIVEYDSRTVNAGFIASVWKDHFEAFFELQAMKWVNFGGRWKIRMNK